MCRSSCCSARVGGAVSTFRTVLSVGTNDENAHRGSATGFFFGVSKPKRSFMWKKAPLQK